MPTHAFPHEADTTQSPCMGNCCLDDDLICLGCFRSLEEIKEWSVVDGERRRCILQAVKLRIDSLQEPPK